jgi:hypothetical protein
MRHNDKLYAILLILFLIIIGSNINGINSFLSVHTDKTIDFGHSETVVPQSWNTTEELNQSKTSNTITNKYIYIDHWDDWPEDQITSISESKFKDMEDGNYKVLKTENTTINGAHVSKQYFSNPTKDNETVWNHIGFNYVFSKEDTNYAVQVHYLTDQDYKNSTFVKEVDEFIAEDINNIHNKNYNVLFSAIYHTYEFITNSI